MCRNCVKVVFWVWSGAWKTKDFPQNVFDLSVLLELATFLSRLFAPLAHKQYRRFSQVCRLTLSTLSTVPIVTTTFINNRTMVGERQAQ